MPFINGIGPLELVIVLVIALIVVGPGRLPDVGSALGKSIREFRKAASDVKDVASVDEKPQSAAGPAAAATTTAVPATAAAAAPAVPSAATAVSPPPPPAATPDTTGATDPAAIESAAAAAAAHASAAPAAPDVSELPEPVHAEDEQPTPTA
jgi:TatA/E family protein of Tat protein translocase